MTTANNLSVLIPCFNESKTIDEILRRVARIPHVGEIIVIDDASTDNSVDIIKKFKDERLQLLVQAQNRGKGAALVRGINLASKKFLIIQDADLEYFPEDIELLMETILSKNADAVFGSRFLTSGSRRAVYYWHRVGNAILTHLSNAFTNLYITDMETCYKLMRTEFAKAMDLQENRFGIEPEVTAKLAALNAIVYEVPIRYSARTYEEGKKIGWKDGVSAIRAIVKYSLPSQKKRILRNLLSDKVSD
jgi:glycosyltransferase involved in cell wall biosynthesis